MNARLTIVKDTTMKGAGDSIVNHNHGGTIRDRGECPACDEFYSFHCESC